MEKVRRDGTRENKVSSSGGRDTWSRRERKEDKKKKTGTLWRREGRMRKKDRTH